MSRNHSYFVCICVCPAAGAAEAAAPVREADVPHRAAETGRDEGSPAEGAARSAGIHSAAIRSHTHKSNTLLDMTHP